MGFLSEMLRMLFDRPVEPVEGRGRFRPQGADFECSDSLDDEAGCDRATRDNDVDPERPVRARDWKLEPPTRHERTRPIEPVEGRGLFRPTAGDFEGGHGLEGPDLADRDVDPELPARLRRRRDNGVDPIPD